MKKYLCVILLILSLSPVCFAHSGKTDSNGGHYDSSTGEYHYHHGYPAHQHTDGECPYDFDDRTGENSGSSVEKSKSSSDKMPFLAKAWFAFIQIALVICVGSFVFNLIIFVFRDLPNRHNR